MGIYEELEQDNVYIFMLGEKSRMQNLPLRVIKSQKIVYF